MPKSSKRRDLPDESELAVNPSVWLRWYEQHLRQVHQEWAQRRRVAREDLELLLFDRSDLERTLKGLPNALSPAERRKLAKSCGPGCPSKGAPKVPPAFLPI